MPKQKDPKAAKVYTVAHDGVGAIGEKGPWAKGHLVAAHHFNDDERRHLHRLIDLGALTPVDDDDLEGIDVENLSRNPWDDNPNVNRELANELARRRIQEGRGTNDDYTRLDIPPQPDNPVGAASVDTTIGNTDIPAIRAATAPAETPERPAVETAEKKSK